MVAHAPRHAFAVLDHPHAKPPDAVLAFQHRTKLHLHALRMDVVDGILQVEIALGTGEVLVLEVGAVRVLPDDRHDRDPVRACGGDRVDFLLRLVRPHVAGRCVKAKRNAPLDLPRRSGGRDAAAQRGRAKQDCSHLHFTVSHAMTLRFPRICRSALRSARPASGRGFCDPREVAQNVPSSRTIPPSFPEASCTTCG